ncbi:MAG: helix-turn-helix transcriptional regulator [Pseudomonadota bacterium]
MCNHIRTLRKDRNWTQADLADRLKVSRQTVIAIERGRYDPSLPLAFAIADLFDLRIDEVFYRAADADQ